MSGRTWPSVIPPSSRASDGSRRGAQNRFRRSSATVGPEIRKTQLFYDINARITPAWAACFAVIALAAVVGSAMEVPGLQTVVTVLGLISAIKFTKSYPDGPWRPGVRPRPA
jgi:hypothetical protein